MWLSLDSYWSLNILVDLYCTDPTQCYKKILRISWMEKVTNKEVLSRLDIKTTMLLQKAKTLKLKYFGHIKRHETLERHILEARIDGRRGRGRPTRRWEQDINDWMDMTTTQAGRLAEDRILFRQKVQEATSRQEISWSRERETQPCRHPPHSLLFLIYKMRFSILLQQIEVCIKLLPWKRVRCSSHGHFGIVWVFSGQFNQFLNDNDLFWFLKYRLTLLT